MLFNVKGLLHGRQREKDANNLVVRSANRPARVGIRGRAWLAQYIHEGPSEHPLDTKRHPDCCLVGLTRFGGRSRGALIGLLWRACFWRTSGRPKAAIDHAPPSFCCVQIPFGPPLDLKCACELRHAVPVILDFSIYQNRKRFKTARVKFKILFR